MNKSILTISIPTYNRPEQVKNQVVNLLPQLNNRVKLIIIDNNSDIPVSTLFNKDILEKITIYTNPTNIGGDANIAKCFEFCTTQWLWTLSDDDYVMPNAIEIVLEEIDKYSEAVYINLWNHTPVRSLKSSDFISEFKFANIYISSFAMSYCLYNMNKLLPYLHYYYDSLSSKVGTVIMVLKYIIDNPNSISVLSNNNPISSNNAEVGWNTYNFIKRSRLFIEAFNNDKIYNSTLFRGCHNTNFILIKLNRKSSNLTNKKLWKLFFHQIKTQKLINVIKYSFRRSLSTFFFLIRKSLLN